MNNNGGAAFPMPSGWNGLQHHEEHHSNDEQQSMSLRDYFAGQALNIFGNVQAFGALCLEVKAKTGGTDQTTGFIARAAYELADAMLAERSKG